MNQEIVVHLDLKDRKGRTETLGFQEDQDKLEDQENKAKTVHQVN